MVAGELMFVVLMLSGVGWSAPRTEVPVPSGLRQDLEHARSDCPYVAEITGTLANARIGQPIDLGEMDAEVWVTHKLDIDAHEDQCISEVLITSIMQERGCKFSLLFQADGVREGLPLTHATLEADSFCLGWPDAEEGRYNWHAGWNAPELTLSKLHVPDRTADRSCVELGMRVNGGLDLLAQGIKTRFSLHDLTVSGWFDSVGDTQAVCPAIPEPEPVAWGPPPKPKPTGDTKNRFDAAITGQFGVALALERYQQEPETANSDLYEFDIGWGAQGSSPTRSIGTGITARFVHKWMGFEARYNQSSPKPWLAELGDTVDLKTSDIPMVALVRWERPNFRPALRVGGAMTKATVFTQQSGVEFTGDDPLAEIIEYRNKGIQAVSFRTELFPQMLVGAEIDMHVEDLYSRLWIDFGFVGSDYSRLSGGAELSVSMTDAFFANGLVEVRGTEFGLYGEDSNDLMASISNRIVHVTMELGFMY